jgi:hypothetical protein
LSFRGRSQLIPQDRTDLYLDLANTYSAPDPHVGLYLVRPKRIRKARVLVRLIEPVHGDAGTDAQFVRPSLPQRELGFD